MLNPVHNLQIHTAELPVSATTAYAAWQLFGTASFIASWWLCATGARLTWTAWGAATTGMIWAASPATGRTVATGLALRSLSLRSSSFVHVHNDVQPTPVQIRPDIHVPQPLVERVEINGRDLRSVD
ncbi:hypothetical protein [Streptomyces sp. NPDC098781]|uniref:hypothetical protein n=1 Tax=Streptomyces sp. NPDC098781 TaxID=3366097 RepID=UPI0037F92790